MEKIPLTERERALAEALVTLYRTFMEIDGGENAEDLAFVGARTQLLAIGIDPDKKT